MKTFNSVTELADATGQSIWTPQGTTGIANAEFIGEPNFANRFEVERLKEKILDIEADDLAAEQEMRRPDDPDRIRQIIDRSLQSRIDKTKDDVADAMMELLEYGVKAYSDNVQYDDYFNEKYGELR